MKSDKGALEFAEYVTELKNKAEIVRVLQNDPVTRAQLIFNITEQMRHDGVDRWNLYCLSPDPVNNLMWSHYACSHTGVCLEFDTSSSVFSYVKEILYTSKFPALRVDRGADEFGRRIEHRGSIVGRRDIFRPVGAICSGSVLPVHNKYRRVMRPRDRQI